MIDSNHNGAWNVVDKWTHAATFYNTDTFDRYRGLLTALMKFTDNFDTVFGVENAHYLSRHDHDNTAPPVADLYFSNLGLFFQSTLRMGPANLTFGARHETTTASEKSATVPRIALTSLLGDFHFKLLYSEAFRLPSGTQYILKQPGLKEIKPERARVAEVEVGYKFNSENFVTTNFFNTLIDSAVRYDGGGYMNAGEIGSRGLEIEYKHVNTWGNLKASLSGYEAFQRSYLKQQSVEDDRAFLGQPRLKATLSGTLNISDSRFFTPSLVYEDFNYVATSNVTQVIPEEKLEPTALLNFYFLETDAFGYKDLDFGVGVWNVFNQHFYYANTDSVDQPMPLPGASREFSLKLAYHY